MAASLSIDLSAVEAFLDGVVLAIAHNASFDRRFCERLLPVFVAKPWACSLREIDWAAEGFESARLASLAAGHGLFFDGHRALHDCEAALDVLSRPLPHSGRTGLSVLLESARRPRWRLRAEAYPLRLTRWPEAPRLSVGGRQRRCTGAWCTEIDEQSFETKCEFLRSTIYRRPEPPIDARLLTAYERYSKWSD